MESDAQIRWERLVERMLASGEATYGNAAPDGPKRAFGATSLKTGGKIFAMLVNGRLVVKLPAARVEALVDDGAGRRFDPGHGRIQREWLDVASDDFETWVALVTESEAFVARRKT
jgi:hypothetical protein